MKDVIKKILYDAKNTPSGDNSQPWRFEVDGNILYIFNIKNSDNPIYNYKQRGSYIAHGSLIENIYNLSKNYNLSLDIDLLPEENKPDLIAKIIFNITSNDKSENLSKWIDSRCTDRRPYDKNILSNEVLNELIWLAEDFSDIEVKFKNNRESINNLSKALSINERMILENREVHDNLFSYIVWSDLEHQKLKRGLYIKTLGLLPPQEKAFSLLKNWSFAKLFTQLGITKLIAKDASKLYQSSGAFGLILIKDNNPKAYIKAGRLLQRIWLHSTKLGISMQPVTALLYLNQRIENNDGEFFSDKQKFIIRESNDIIKQEFNYNDLNPVMLFRLGVVKGNPSITSLKSDPLIEYL